MVQTCLRQRKFISDCIDILSVQYSRNRSQLHKLIKNAHNIPEPIGIIINLQSYLYKPSDIKEVNRLINEQIKINKIVTAGKDILRGEQYKNKIE